MADEKLNTGPSEENISKAHAPAAADRLQAPASEQAAPALRQEHAGPEKPDPGDAAVPVGQINKLMGETQQTARAEIKKAEADKAARGRNSLRRNWRTEKDPPPPFPEGG